MSYRNLKVYQRAHAFGVACHSASLRLPKYELFESGSQLRRASKSVSANIVEGYGRRGYPAEYNRFLVIALASNDESMEWLTYVSDCHPDLQEHFSPLINECEEIGRMMTGFMRSLEGGD